MLLLSHDFVVMLPHWHASPAPSIKPQLPHWHHVCQSLCSVCSTLLPSRNALSTALIARPHIGLPAARFPCYHITDTTQRGGSTALMAAITNLVLHASRLALQPSACLLYTSPSPRDRQKSRMPSSA